MIVDTKAALNEVNGKIERLDELLVKLENLTQQQMSLELSVDNLQPKSNDPLEKRL